MIIADHVYHLAQGTTVTNTNKMAQSLDIPQATAMPPAAVSSAGPQGMDMDEPAEDETEAERAIRANRAAIMQRMLMDDDEDDPHAQGQPPLCALPGLTCCSSCCLQTHRHLYLLRTLLCGTLHLV